MADAQHLKFFHQGVRIWNGWRRANPEIVPDLSNVYLKDALLENADLSGADLSGASLRFAHIGGADLSGASLGWADLSNAYINRANFSDAHLRSADFSKAQLIDSDLSRAKLIETKLVGADLSGTNLNRAKLFEANLSGAKLVGSNLREALCYETMFVDTNLSAAIGLETCLHDGPSIIDHRTLAKSGALPLAFLRGCGLPDTLINYLPSLLNQPIQFYSCFISYSTKDQDFADRLYADLQNKGVRCWFAPHDMQGGKKLHEQIDEAIRLYERLLLILSPSSMDSEWVKTEIAKARKRELQEKRRMLFPVRLVEFGTLRDWECFDSDAGKDSAREIREYYVPDFSNWKDHDAYQKEFDKLLRDLKSKEKLKDS